MDFDSSRPIYLQVVDDIKKRIVLGIYKPGEKLPSGRELAVNYNINPNTAVKIYQELESQEICEIRRGLGTFVAGSTNTISGIKNEMAEKTISDFITEMKQLGFSYSEMHELISEREVDSNDGA